MLSSGDRLQREAAALMAQPLPYGGYGAVFAPRWNYVSTRSLDGRGYLRRKCNTESGVSEGQEICATGQTAVELVKCLALTNLLRVRFHIYEYCSH